MLGKDDELTLTRQDYKGNELRLDGIYYLEKENFEGIIYQRYALFRNGVIRDLGAPQEIDAPRILSGKSKSNWGVFQISNGEIKFERWYPGEELKAYMRSGVILNDSTFKITESYRNQNGEKTEVETMNEVYHFKSFSPKPDST
ncbi:MAG: hypothetical protein EOP53_15610, partial [Sphingobacteriales bacterium]